MKKLGTCIRPGCGEEATARGLCRGCYHAAKAAVKKQWVTWQKLEEMGKLLPKRQGKSCVAWPWLMDWCKDPVVQRQIALGPIPPERPAREPKKARGGWPKGKPRKPPPLVDLSQARDPVPFGRPTQ